MWGQSFARPALELRQILKFDNTAGVKNKKCDAKIVTPAVGLGQILKVFNTAALIRMKCGVNCFVRPAVGLRKIWTIL
jgi:hypothetical protein